MKTIYVAGPVLRGPSSRLTDTQISKFYLELRQRASINGDRIYLPVVDSVLEYGSDQNFYNEIIRRITEADFVVTIVSQRNTAPPMESMVSRFLGRPKKQVIVFEN